MRRANNEGNIRKRSDGRWEGRYTAGINPETGKQIQRSVYGKTQKEVREKLTEKLSQIDIGTYVDPKKILLIDYLEDWLWNTKRNHVKPKTFDGYNESINVHIKGTQLSRMSITEIRRHHIQTWIDGKVKSGDSAYVTNYAYGIIRNAMNDAVRRGLLVMSHADKVSLPKKKSRPTRIMTEKEQEIFINTISGHRLEAAFYVALTTGIRQGELTALKWSDYDEVNGTLKICRDAIRVNIYDESKKKTGSKILIQESPKTDAGFRTLPLLPGTITSLRKHRQRQSEEKNNHELYNDEGLIFCDEVGRLYDPKNFYSRLQDICNETDGLEKIKWHALRHTYSTRALEADVTGKALQGLLGHETEAQTLKYQHLLVKQAKKEVNKMKDSFTNGSKVEENQALYSG